MQVNQMTIASWKIVVDDDVKPDSVTPEPEVEDSCMELVTRPVLFFGINYHLSSTILTI